MNLTSSKVGGGTTVAGAAVAVVATVMGCDILVS
jgi:hypothetical protein